MHDSTIVERLRECSIKVTPQRIAIVKYLMEHRTHPDAEEIYRYVKQQHPSISLATIYNTLDKLEEKSVVIKLKISDDNRVNYDYNDKLHHHFYCKECGSIIDIDVVCEYAKLGEVEGHRIDEVHGYYKGICSKCREK